MSTTPTTANLHIYQGDEFHEELTVVSTVDAQGIPDKGWTASISPANSPGEHVKLAVTVVDALNGIITLDLPREYTVRDISGEWDLQYSNGVTTQTYIRGVVYFKFDITKTYTDTPGPVPGPPGPEGPAGPQGETGPAGPQGVSGPVGPVGPDGPFGETGPIGPKGDTGPDGERGLPGPQGPQGERGERGTQGIKGDKGDQGAQGPEGPAGPLGPEGELGERGITGERGPKGDPGPVGDPGPQGVAGIQGPQGIPGPDGAQGPQGAQGVPGIPNLSIANGRAAVNVVAGNGSTNIVIDGGGTLIPTIGVTLETTQVDTDAKARITNVTANGFTILVTSSANQVVAHWVAIYNV